MRTIGQALPRTSILALLRLRRHLVWVDGWLGRVADRHGEVV